nr:MAG TPA: hypothetical protein [Caudoviricetes sp.]DAV47701.1 MAG TPA: hypothetical protein [Caudoviricetes sp.]
MGFQTVRKDGACPAKPPGRMQGMSKTWWWASA